MGSGNYVTYTNKGVSYCLPWNGIFALSLVLWTAKTKHSKHSRH